MKGNPLGDIRAENDVNMLEQAFIETQDYKTLVDSIDRSVIVGRRGTGKSALAIRLGRFWSKEQNTYVISVAPEDTQIIGLRSLMETFGNNYVHIKAAAKIAWKYALYMEVIKSIEGHFKLKKLLDFSELNPHLKAWKGDHINLVSKLRGKIDSVIDPNKSPEINIADLSQKLRLQELENQLQKICSETGHRTIILIDRLDEGYTPDDVGVAIVDAFVQTINEINSKFNSQIRGLVFLRDNVFRSIALKDPDFTRNTEGQVLRLHWDQYGLFNLVCNRLRVAFSLNQENSRRLWNKVTARELQNENGFKLILRLTLYRPRDVLVLLNNAFYHASKQDRKVIIPNDIDVSAKTISNNRFRDLNKEYVSSFPSIEIWTSRFGEADKALMNSNDVKQLINPVIKAPDKFGISIEAKREIAFLSKYDEVIKRMYSIGFLGIRDEISGKFKFCHDGSDPVETINSDSQLMVHPCYWLALNLPDKALNPDQAEEIHDEYEFKSVSSGEEIRTKKVEPLLQEIKRIEPGKSGADAFEQWVYEAIRLIFAGSLTNIELKPNNTARQRRDIIATNMSETPVWDRVLKDYNARQIIFEIKNYDELSQQDFRQMNTYLNGSYGSFGIFITRSTSNNLYKKEIDWVKEIFFKQERKLIIKLSEKYLTKHLGKIRNPQKHDESNIELNKLLDRYIRQYLE